MIRKMNRKNICGILISVICIAVLCSCGNVRDVDMTNETYQENILQDNVENTEEDIKKDTENTENTKNREDTENTENTENTDDAQNTVQESDKSENYISESVVKKETGTLEETITASDLPLLSRVDSWPEEAVEMLSYGVLFGEAGKIGHDLEFGLAFGNAVELGRGKLHPGPLPHILDRGESGRGEHFAPVGVGVRDVRHGVCAFRMGNG